MLQGLARAPACGVVTLGLGTNVPPPELALADRVPAAQLHQVEGLPLGLAVLGWRRRPQLGALLGLIVRAYANPGRVNR